ncbi:tetratricopeptide repeat protein [Paenibacillus daejeonensis]|uniref:tetratricopeptide repeat protein n=1 Tax=Paenibacillus daejeonensis TaxID=135193 RepID=UPI00037BDAA5|nr:hypothetical protein [Paenibacillus daejeonensis]
MITHLFATMHEKLDDLMERCPDGVLTDEDQAQLATLMTLSDQVMDHWVQFEEKLSLFRQGMEGEPAEQEEAEELTTGFDEGQSWLSRGQGYFKLFMFRQAADALERAVGSMPECNLSRMFLAMTYMHLQQWLEAQRLFQMVVALTDHPKWKALSFNALGCIQAVRLNLDEAEAYFMRAHQADPTFSDPLNNLNSCRKRAGHLSLYFGSGELSCL